MTREWEGYTEATYGTNDKPVGTEIQMPAQVSSALLASGACPTGYTERWFKTNKYRYSYVPVQWVRTGNKSTLKYSYQETNNTNLEATFAKEGNGWSAGIGGSLEELDSRDFTFDFTNNVHKVAKLEWEYRSIDQYCVPSGPAYYYATGLVRWAPNKVSSGSQKRDTSTNFTCNDAYVSDMQATTTIVRSSYVAWNGWFSVAGGFKADLNQRNDTTEKLTFIPDAGQSAKLCGSNAKPLDANRVKEIS